MSRKSAFTLVELLVVIGIISVLIAILLPALNKARAAANTVACASNMRQIVTAMFMYANNNHGYLPPADLRLPGSPGNPQVLTWDDLLDPYLGLQRSQAVLESWRSSVDVPVLRCPADTLPVDPGLGVVARRRSYAITAETNPPIGGGFGRQLSVDASGMITDTGAPFVKITSARRPTETILLFEAIWPDNVIGYSGHDCHLRPADQSPGFKPIHNGKYNYAFADGHVRLMAPQDTIPAGQPLTYAGGMWTRTYNH